MTACELSLPVGWATAVGAAALATAVAVATATDRTHKDRKERGMCTPQFQAVGKFR
jgi:hypothetical protein